MVYKKGYTRKRYARKPVAWYNKKHSVGDVASAAWKGVKMLKGIINSEKHWSNYNASFAASTTPGVIALSVIAQDDTNSGRQGNSILAKSLTVNLQFVISSAATTSVARIIFFVDLQQLPDNSPTATDILEGDYLSQLKIASLGRYKVLADYKVPLSISDKRIAFRALRSRFDHHIRYNGTASTDIQKGGIYMLYLSNEATNTVSVTYNARLGFYDN